MVIGRDVEKLWRYKGKTQTPDIVVMYDESEDSKQLVQFLLEHCIPFTRMPSKGRPDPDEWTDALPAVFLPGESRGGSAIVFRGLRQIHTQFLARFSFHEE
jgi:hypothetical protein